MSLRKLTIALGIIMFYCSTTASAAESSSTSYNAKHFDSKKTFDEQSQVESYEPKLVEPTTITFYELEYIEGATTYYGAWRDGVSGGSGITDIEIYFNYQYDESYNIDFTASVSGEYSLINHFTIGGELGVSLGKASSYSFGSGATILVPKDCHYLIRYRPTYKKWTVIEKTYIEVYQNGYLLSRHLAETKTCVVDVFSYWDYTAVYT